MDRSPDIGWSRVVLGTVQFGLPYGRRRDQGTLRERSVHEILAEAWKAGVRAFDTAEGYGLAAGRLVSWLSKDERLSQSRVVTKLATQFADDESRVEAACARFSRAASLTLLSHGALSATSFAIFKEIAGPRATEVGQSVYTAAEVRCAEQAGASRVQAPVSIIDNRQIEAAQDADVALDARSIFLQGLLLDSSEAAEKRVPGSGRVVLAIRSAAQKAYLPTAVALLAGVFSRLGPRDRAVIGIDAPAQLAEVSAAFEAPASSVRHFSNLVSETISAPGSLLDPRTWS